MSLQDERELDALFAGYRAAVPDFSGGADFLPRIWQRIEAVRNPGRTWRIWANAFATASVALCLLLVLVTASIERAQASHTYNTTYVEVLADDGSNETLAFAQLPVSEEPLR